MQWLHDIVVYRSRVSGDSDGGDYGHDDMLIEFRCHCKGAWRVAFDGMMKICATSRRGGAVYDEYEFDDVAD